jgi:hypothetical protein
VKNRFQNLPFKFNLQRYIEATYVKEEAKHTTLRAAVGPVQVESSS